MLLLFAHAIPYFISAAFGSLLFFFFILGDWLDALSRLFSAASGHRSNGCRHYHFPSHYISFLWFLCFLLYIFLFLFSILFIVYFQKLFSFILITTDKRKMYLQTFSEPGRFTYYFISRPCHTSIWSHTFKYFIYVFDIYDYYLVFTCEMIFIYILLSGTFPLANLQ